jgi:integrase
MALTEVVRNEASDVYIAALRGMIGAINNILLERDRWGFRTLQECFGIDGDSAIYVPDHTKDQRRQSIERRCKDILEGPDCYDYFLRNVGYDFTILHEPYKTELKAYFAWRLSRLESRSYDWHTRSVRLIQFIADIYASSMGLDNALPRYLIEFGHPIESGNGNASTALRAIMEEWLKEHKLSTSSRTQLFRTRTSSSDATVIKKTYGSPLSMPANNLLFTLVILREKCLPLEKRNLILLEDVYPQDEVPEVNRKEPYIHFYGFRLPWLRNAARRFVLSKIEHKELSSSTIPSYIARLMFMETCLLEKYPTPQIDHITQTFVDEDFLNWGNGRKLSGKNWYADCTNMLRYASSYMNNCGWPQLSFDKRNLRRVDGDWPGGRAYQQKVENGMVPEEVVEQIFLKFGTLPIVCKRLLIIVRYTGMRCSDLHTLSFQCLKSDPDDPQFMLLTFYQSKVKRWNTKPLHIDDAAHALVIKAIVEQREDIIRDWGRETKYLFPNKSGDREVSLSRNYTREIIARWIIANDIRDKGGKIYEFGWHDFRHFYGTELALAGHDIVLIQMELGHVSADMTMVYINQRLKLKKKAVLEKGGGKFITIKGEVDDKIAELAVRKDAALSVDVPGGLCSLPGQIGEWCEHNRACFTCIYFRGDIEQLPFFEGERRSMTATLDRLISEVAEHEQNGRLRMAEIGRKRIIRIQEQLANVVNITTTIKSEGIYSGGSRKYERAACGSGGAECQKAASGRGNHQRNASKR